MTGEKQAGGQVSHLRMDNKRAPLLRQDRRIISVRPDLKTQIRYGSG